MQLKINILEFPTQTAGHVTEMPEPRHTYRVGMWKSKNLASQFRIPRSFIY